MPETLSPFITPNQPQTNSARAKREILHDADSTKAALFVNDNIHQQLPMTAIRLAGDNYRQIDLDDAAVFDGLCGLCASIMVNGLVQPIVVSAMDPAVQTHALIAGHRRFLACQMSKQLANDAAFRATYFDEDTLSLCQPIQHVDVFIRYGQQRDQARAVMFIENIQRENPSIIDEALGLKEVMAMTQKNQTEIARVIGKNPIYVSEVLKVLKVAEPILVFIHDRNNACRDRKTIAELDRAYQLAPEKVIQLLSDYEPQSGIVLREAATEIKTRAQHQINTKKKSPKKDNSRATPILGFALKQTKTNVKLTVLKRGRDNEQTHIVTQSQLIELRNQINSLLD